MHHGPARPFALPRPTILIAVTLLACGPDKGGETGLETGTSEAPVGTTSTGTTSVPTTSSTGHTTGDTAACMCTAFAEVEGGCSEDNLWDHVPACSLDLICPTLTVQCPHPNADLYMCETQLVFDEAALTCVLTALRDRTPGRFVVEGTEAGPMYFGTLYGMRLRGEDAAVVSECRSGEGTGWSATTRTLAAPEHFSECLTMPSPLARHTCLLAGLTNEVELPACGE